MNETEICPYCDMDLDDIEHDTDNKHAVCNTEINITHGVKHNLGY